jgi:hypothetical protein
MLCFLLIQCLLFWLRVSCSAVTLSTSVFETIFISSTFLRNFVTASTLTGTSIPLSFTLEHLWVSHWNTFEFHIGTPLSFTSEHLWVSHWNTFEFHIGTPLSFTSEHLWVSHWNTFEFHIGTPLSFTSEHLCVSHSSQFIFLLLTAP